MSRGKKMTEIVAVCSGTFDPPTKGHEDIVRRAAELFGSVCVLVSVNPNKKTVFSKEERVQMCEKVFGDDPRISVAAYDGFVVDYCNRIGAKVIVKGVRNAADCEYEAESAFFSAKLSGGKTDTVFLPAKPELGHVSSSAVRELLAFGADISDYVSEKILRDIRKKYCEEV